MPAGSMQTDFVARIGIAVSVSTEGVRAITFVARIGIAVSVPLAGPTRTV